MVYKRTMFLLCFTIVLLCDKTVSQGEENSFFTDAETFVLTKVSPNALNYDSGGDCMSPEDNPEDQLFGCRLSSYNTAELRVCKHADGCEELINSSLQFNRDLHSEGVKVVRFDETILKNLKCYAEQDEAKLHTCRGYLEEWIEDSAARLVKVGEKIFQNDEDTMISDIKDYQTEYANTKTHIEKIIEFMTPDAGKCTNYRRICYLEGFFRETGGFEITNPTVKSKMMLSDHCNTEDTDATTKRVLEVLEKFKTQLAPPSSGK